MFLLGPPGTAKSMVAARLKRVFKDGKSFDYLMSRFSTPDEIFGPISISRLKNDDKYERLTEGYLPEADVVFLDEIWKAGPSIQNTLLTVINEHVFYNGAQMVETPMKTLIAASNELPAKDEGLEALWDRFLVRMVSNCIESDSAFFKMMRSTGDELGELPESLYITDEIYRRWQEESKSAGMKDEVVMAIKALRKSMAGLEKDDGNQLRYYISDRRWRKAYRLMQTSAYLNGRSEIDLTDYLLLAHSMWNDVECIPNVLEAFTQSIASDTLRSLGKIEKAIRQMMGSQNGAAPSQQPAQKQSAPQLSNEFAEYDYFYYMVENYGDGETYFSKWDYALLDNTAKDGVKYYDTKRNKTLIHTMVKGRPFDAAPKNATNLTKVKIMKCAGGAIIDGMPYAFKRKEAAAVKSAEEFMPVYQRVEMAQMEFEECVEKWRRLLADNWDACSNIFVSSADLGLVNKMRKEVEAQIKSVEVRLNNVRMMMR